MGTKDIMMPHSQERILELANARTHGGKFLATGGAIFYEEFFQERY